MRKLFSLLFIFSFIFSVKPCFSDYPSTLTPLSEYSLRPLTDDILVYASKSLKANIAGYITPNEDDDIQVLDVIDDWCYIAFPSIQGVSYGYVPLSYFDYTPASTPVPASDATLPYSGGSIGWINNLHEGQRLNLRSEPLSTAKSLGKYFTGTSFIFTGNAQNGFVQVLLAGTTFGWLDERFVTTDAVSFVPETPTVMIHNPGSGAVLRSGPSTTYDRIGWFSHGTAVNVLGVQENGWHHVQINDLVGYVSPTLLTGTFPYDNGIDSDNPVTSDHSSNGTTALYINTRSSDSKLHLRKSANTNAKSLGLFYTGTPVQVLDYTRDGWAYVRIGQTEGYMDANYLTSIAPVQYGKSFIVRNSRATGLNLRSLPSTGGELLEFAPNYAAVTVLGELSDGWCYVTYNNTLGYMLGTSLKQE